MGKTTPVKKITPARWYKNEQFEYEKELKTKGKIVAHFEVTCGRYGRAIRGEGARRQLVKYLRVFENGMAVIVDTKMMKISVTQTLGQPFKLKVAKKSDFDRALKAVIKLIA